METFMYFLKTETHLKVRGMERLYRVSDVAKMLNVSTVTVRKWIKAGKLGARRVGKLWMIPEGELRRFLGEKPREVRAVIYARVSSHKQKRDGNLGVVADVASGLKEDRSGLQKIFDMVEGRRVDVIVVEFRDRLTRFGFEYLRRYFESYGARVEVVEESEKGYMEELIEDFVALVTSFAARIYGKRSRKFRKIKRVIEEVVGDD